MTSSELADAIEKAFDYRGDVTVDLKDGRQVVGYMTNREHHGTPDHLEPFVELMLPGQSELLRLSCRDIANVRLTGEDAAAGKSWEEWVAKEAAKKKAQGKA
jgi:hypothetical protein